MLGVDGGLEIDPAALRVRLFTLSVPAFGEGELAQASSGQAHMEGASLCRDERVVQCHQGSGCWVAMVMVAVRRPDDGSRPFDSLP